MKKLFFGVLMLLAGLTHYPCFAAQQCETNILIPNRYAVAICKDVNTEAKMDEKTVIESAKNFKESAKVEQVSIVFYAPGKKQGDGAFAMAAYGGLNPDGLFYVAPDEEAGKMLEKLLGYEIEPKDLWAIYEDNEFVADEDFKGKPIILAVENTGLAKDVTGKPYIKVPTDKHGLFGLQIYFKTTDPFLRKLKKGQTLVVRAYPKRFVVRTVILEGRVLYIEDEGK